MDRRQARRVEKPKTTRRGRRPGCEGLERRELLSTITEIPLATPNAQPQGIVTGTDGNLWFTQTNGNQIGRLNPTTRVVTNFPISTAGSLPTGISTGPSGNTNLFFTEPGTSKIGQISTAGTITEFATKTANSQPQGITAGPPADGGVWFTEIAANQLGRIDPTTHIITEFPVTTPNSGVSGITAAPDGNLWFTEATANQIGKMTPAGFVTEYKVPSANSRPLGITVGPDGAIWFTEAAAGKIGRVNITTGVITEIPTPTANAQPLGIVSATTADGNLWFTEATADQIGRLNPITGFISEFSIPTPASSPNGITVGPDKNLWFAETNGNRIAVLDRSQIIVPGSLPVTATTGTSFTGVVATFSLTNLVLPSTSFSATINWGDGTITPAVSLQPSAGGSLLSVVGTHTYASAGSYTITTVLNDGLAGDTATATSPATVTAPVVPIAGAPRVTSVSRESNRPGAIVLGFNTALDPTAAENVFNYTIVRLGPVGQFDTADQIAAGLANNVYLHVTSATFNPASNAVTLTTYENLNNHAVYVLIVNGRPAHPTANGESPNGLTNVNGVYLDGGFAGVPSGDYATAVPALFAPLVAPGSTVAHFSVPSAPSHHRAFRFRHTGIQRLGAHRHR